MGKRTPSAPAAPDPAATARAQTAANRETAITQANLNMVNQTTPYGRLRYEQRGTAADGTPQYEAIQELAPEQQKMKNLQDLFGIIGGGTAVNQMARASDALSRPVDFSNVGPARVDTISTEGLPGLVSQASARNQVQYNIDPTQRGVNYDLDFSAFGDPNISRNRVEDALLQRMNPQLEQDRQRLETQLANQGIGIGSAAYNQEMDRFARQTNDARLAAILNAGQEQSRIFGLGLAQGQFGNQAQNQEFGQNLGRGQFFNTAQQQDFGQSLSNANLANQARAQGFNENLTRANFQNAARQNAIAEILTQRQTPLNEVAAMMSGTQVAPMGFMNTPQTGVQGTDVAGPQALAYQGQLANWQAGNQANNAMMGGLFGLGSALGGGYLASGGRFF